jgi:hypothetical protein
MNIICEMRVDDFFNLSTGHIALVGKIIPNIEKFITKSKADLYVGNAKIKTIHIIGEDKFSGVNESIKQEKRAVRTDDDIIADLRTKIREIKLIIYID